jgi:RimJ/RimL family protein N-acetyltransferase
MPTFVKQAKDSDWRDLRAVRLKALESDPGVFASTLREESAMTEIDWKEWLKSDDIAIFLIYDDATLVGMTGIVVDRNDPDKKKAILWGSWLEPSARGKGLSQILYQARLEWAREHPTIEDMIVSHRASNLFSRRANQRHGFVFTHAADRMWPDGTNEEELFYVLKCKE